MDNIGDVDNVVGGLAEYTRPHGFAISETEFHVSIINASPRLFSDRFFTSSFRPEFYSRLGYDWVMNNGPLDECPYTLEKTAAGELACNEPDKVIGNARTARAQRTLWISRRDILSPMTTVPDAQLGSSPPTGGTGTILGSHFAQTCGVEESDETCLRFVRTISTDDRLIEKLVTELGHRDIEPTDDIVVISEWDTYYGRSLPDVLLETLTWHYADDGKEICLHRYTYERGIDGLGPGARPAEAKGPKRRDKTQVNGHIIDDRLTIRRPEGSGQFDYLRRLSTELLAKDRRLRIAGGKGVRAVAILGSDVYDKLLILRALRPKLPGAVWLTTDLDANFLHPSEYKWVRNMIISSTYGLLPSEKLKVSTPPFRDNYQSSNYVATQVLCDVILRSPCSR